MFSLPELPYDYTALEPHIDELTMRVHHDKHHAGYVTNLNAALENHPKFLAMEVNELLRDLSGVPEDIRTKVRNNGGGHANHSLFWQVMAPASAMEPQGSLLGAIKTAFGDVATMKNQFTQAALGRFGSGWAWLVVEGNGLTILDTPNQDTPLMESVPAGSPRVEVGRQKKIPILGLDVWEHAYYLKYQNRRAEYIQAWWNVVNWDAVAEKYQKAMS